MLAPYLDAQYAFKKWQGVQIPYSLILVYA